MSGSFAERVEARVVAYCERTKRDRPLAHEMQGHILAVDVLNQEDFLIRELLSAQWEHAYSFWARQVMPLHGVARWAEQQRLAYWRIEAARAALLAHRQAA